MEMLLAAISEPATVISGLGATLGLWLLKKVIRIDRKLTRIETGLARCPLLKEIPPQCNED